ncbi:MAG: hypothetical protein H0T83_06100 [Chthoniobacterales bacterium]|nr:hypothetical protein [Chthoniobacterales bacterium]
MLPGLHLIMTANPGFGGQAFSPPSIQKLRVLQKMIAEFDATCEVKVDGGINPKCSWLVPLSFNQKAAAAAQLSILTPNEF